MKDGRLLRRTQWGTLLLGAASAGTLALLDRPESARGLAIGSIWAAANLRTLEGVLTAAIRPLGANRDLPRLFLWSLAKLGIYVLAVWMLFIAPFPVASMVHGLTVMLAALVTVSVVDGRKSDSRHGRKTPLSGPGGNPLPGPERGSERGDDVQA